MTFTRQQHGSVGLDLSRTGVCKARRVLSQMNYCADKTQLEYFFEMCFGKKKKKKKKNPPSFLLEKCTVWENMSAVLEEPVIIATPWNNTPLPWETLTDPHRCCGRINTGVTSPCISSPTPPLPSPLNLPASVPHLSFSSSITIVSFIKLRNCLPPHHHLPSPLLCYLWLWKHGRQSLVWRRRGPAVYCGRFGSVCPFLCEDGAGLFLSLGQRQ